VWRTVALVVYAWAAAAATTCAAYLAVGSEAVPISVGLFLGLAFVVLLSLLHRAFWLAVLSVVPGLFVLVGAVQYAPEAALERRGVRSRCRTPADRSGNTTPAEGVLGAWLSSTRPQ
jgi:predicted membrane channel-forming protein YqfA (hemolysin III family)